MWVRSCVHLGLKAGQVGVRNRQDLEERRMAKERRHIQANSPEKESLLEVLHILQEVVQMEA
jgi:hypothetical protein